MLKKSQCNYDIIESWQANGREKRAKRPMVSPFQDTIKCLALKIMQQCACLHSLSLAPSTIHKQPGGIQARKLQELTQHSIRSV